MSNKTTPKPKPDADEIPVAPPEPTEAELIARRQAALEEYGIVDRPADEQISSDDDE